MGHIYVADGGWKDFGVPTVQPRLTTVSACTPAHPGALVRSPRPTSGIESWEMELQSHFSTLGRKSSPLVHRGCRMLTQPRPCFVSSVSCIDRTFSLPYFAIPGSKAAITPASQCRFAPRDVASHPRASAPCIRFTRAQASERLKADCWLDCLRPLETRGRAAIVRGQYTNNVANSRPG